MAEFEPRLLFLKVDDERVAEELFREQSLICFGTMKRPFSLAEFKLRLLFFQVDDERVAEELFREQSSPGVSAAASSRDEEEEDYDDRWGDIYEDAPARY